MADQPIPVPTREAAVVILAQRLFKPPNGREIDSDFLKVLCFACCPLYGAMMFTDLYDEIEAFRKRGASLSYIANRVMEELESHGE